MEIEIAIAVILLFVLTLLATVDMAFVQLSDLSLRRLTSDTVENPSVNTGFLREILENRPRFRFALSAAIQTLLIIFSVLVTMLTLRFFPFERAQDFLISIVIGLVLSGIFRQVIPRALTFNNPERVLLFFLPILRPIYGVLSFVSDPFHRVRPEKIPNLEKSVIPNLLDEAAPHSNETETDASEAAENIQTLIEAGEAEGIIEERERELIETIVSFGDTLANEVMTPRTEIEAVPIDATLRETLDLIIEEKYSRLPVYREQIDNVEGMIYVRDLLQHWREGRIDETIENLPGVLRQVNFVPETKPIAELLKEMQTARVQMAMIIDEYGGVAGLVTIEDILEELVGEIEDEDTSQEEIIEIVESEDKSHYDVLGSVEIDKIENLFDIDLDNDDEDFTTVAGLAIYELGYVPKVGEMLQLRGLSIEILQADERRVNLLRLRRADEPINTETED